MPDRGIILAGYGADPVAVRQAAGRLRWPVIAAPESRVGGGLRWPRLLEALGALPAMSFGRPPVARFVEDWLVEAREAVGDEAAADEPWVQWWQGADEVASAAAARSLEGAWGAPVVAAAVARALPDRAGLHLANSLAIRDAFEFGGGLRAYANVGVNGIDGTLSTALGEAWATPDAPLCLLVGDLAFLHDQGGLLVAGQLPGRVTAVVVDDGGGGIFRNLPAAAAVPPDVRDRFFVTPQTVDHVALCAAHGVPARSVTDAVALTAALRDNLERPGLGVVVADVRGCDDVGLRTVAAEAAHHALQALGGPP